MEVGGDAAARIRRLVAAHLPGHAAGDVALLGEGADHVAYLVGGDLVVRFARAADAGVRGAQVERDARLLRAVARLSPLPVPAPAFVDADAGCLAYARLPGVPLLALPPSARATHALAVARELGAFLAALHGAPAEPWRALVDTDLRPAAAWRDEAADTYAAVAGSLPATHRGRVAAFLGAPPPVGAVADVRPAFTHNDLGIEHVLVEPRTGHVCGVIDWSDAALADPAADLARLERDLGPAAMEAALRAYGRPGAEGALRARATFYARCLVLEDLAYGLEGGNSIYVEKSVSALAWLFPA